MPRVKLDNSLVSAIHLPSRQDFARLASPEILLLVLTVAFVASAETPLSASAVHPMHTGPRTD